MGKRKQPFGYKMELGEIVPQPQEAETVRSIYLQYLAGASFKQLAEQLQTENVPYDVAKPWNKNMLARVLEKLSCAHPDGAIPHCPGTQKRDAP